MLRHDPTCFQAGNV